MTFAVKYFNNPDYFSVSHLLRPPLEIGGPWPRGHGEGANIPQKWHHQMEALSRQPQFFAVPSVCFDHFSLLWHVLYKNVTTVHHDPSSFSVS